MVLLRQYAILIIAFLTVSACNKDNSNPDTNKSGSKASVNFHLTDGPAEYDAVYIDIQRVQLTMEGSGMIELTPVRPGMYDLLKFRNGLDTLLLRADIPAGKVSQIRLILGSENYVVVDGDMEKLNTPSAQESGLKLNLKEEFVAGGSYDIWIDFDAGKSIHETGNGKFQLKPVIKAYSALTDGRIKGYVLPGAALVTVYASNGIDTYAAIPDEHGYFLFAGLPEGNYTITYDAAPLLFVDLVVKDIKVTYGQTIDLGTRVLTQ
jgi:hypothetical protein